ncbi:DUF2188 domain-containing protein [Chitinophaga ginsengisegetis]|uniref:DUF2188 domain-containing protein n=1 Tax=Chitinophaga ginsengisegetis TaxID=393003 RepID=UPI000DBA5A48|nr:DUF2188 domain-containing protein [Chitinophaga ginsengisegetis]MDR6571349.1 hypothetical protein [Chitinophaga ginsengisegetis]MDR6651082.1 hypothetical protein [Chitinophaga ginsengisegetis]MDR6657432.1 hypothetical protein [Chitinophaga ginsengisegetis]
MSKKNVHVVPNSGGWGVRVEGNEKNSKNFDTQKQAIEYGREKAQNSSAELLIHGQNGKIREKNSYGNDRYPPKG